MTDTINVAIKEHETGVPWEHRAEAQLCHRFFEVFNETFFEGKLPTCFLQFERVRVSNLGRYRPGRNGVGALHQINLNVQHLTRPHCDLLATLLHEMVRQWQEMAGKPGKRGYYNREFTRKCQQVGILCSGGYGSRIVGHTEPFVSLLRAHGIEAEVTEKTAERARGQSKLKKWSCGCTNIRSAVEVQARCLRCGNLFVEAEIKIGAEMSPTIGLE